MRLKFALVALLGILASARGAFAQGCALCYASASALGASGQRSLDYGILALLTPALILFLSVMLLLYRRAVSATV
ncbi:MAG TPA: hypothetical protein VN792_03035 [Candidatus Acidoferrales bacterium]|nr:hypothetical protein [Candidatus Acidoferrales bacterium]